MLGRRTGWRQRGSAAVEFIILLTPLLFLLFGIIEASRLLLTVGVVADAAREGARTGAVTPLVGGVGGAFDNNAAVTRIASVLSAANLTTSSPPDVTCPACAPGATVTATVTVEFQTPVPLLVPIFGSSFTVRRKTEMRYE